MKKARTRLAARYLTALRTHLGKKSPGKGDHKGDRAQGLGRAALAGGLVTLDLAIMHEQAVVARFRQHGQRLAQTGVAFFHPGAHSTSRKPSWPKTPSAWAWLA